MVKNGKRNALVEKQEWKQLVYVDALTFDEYLGSLEKTFDWSIYYFSGMSERGTIRVDSNPNTNANCIMDVFEHMKTMKPNTVPCIFEDALFLYYNPNGKVIENAIKKGEIPETVRNSKYLVKTKNGNLGFKINQWQFDMFNLVIPGGFFVSKRPTVSHTQILTDNPKMFYVHDTRSFAHLVRIDQKPFNYKEPKEYLKWVEEQDQINFETLDKELENEM